MKRALKTAAYLLECYVAIAHLVYAFRHPELTETQRFLQTWSALTWM